MNLNFEKFKVQVCKICFQYKLKIKHENTCPKDTMEAEMAEYDGDVYPLWERHSGGV